MIFLSFSSPIMILIEIVAEITLKSSRLSGLTTLMIFPRIMI